MADFAEQTRKTRPARVFDSRPQTAGDTVELRLVGVSEDGQQLVLIDDSGDQHSLAIDDRLRAAVHGHLSRLGQLTMALESRISPREIQERVRSGESAEHVAVTAGVPLERVLRFVGPVLREREHVVEQAQVARLAGGNGPTSGPTSLLADVVSRAASRQGIDPDELIWDSARREDHSWLVTVGWPNGSTAAWALDLTRHQASPVDAAARRISGVADDPVVLHASANVDADEPDVDSDSGSAADGADDRDTIRLFVPRTVPAFDEHEPPDIEPDDEPDDEKHTASIESASVEQPELGAELDEPSTPAVTPTRAARSSRRARVPKWDDIMFGPKSKD